MIYLIHYDRRSGKIVQFAKYSDADRATAEGVRFFWESNTDDLDDQEIVLLEAQSEEDLRKTHQRYFASASDLLKSAADEASTSATKP